ncbi:MAG: cytidylate kinase [Chloroflexi bacterium UTCFX4]|jgi:cytidylate kinase|nr:MAG: cytidylate kinase [Chloroflexi bacterium UTCFX4]
MSFLSRAIAIDGPAASGKSALAEQLAARLNYFYLDTGLMYRAVTNQALARAIPIQDEQAVTQLAESMRINALPPADGVSYSFSVTVDGHDVSAQLHRPEVDRNVSVVSAYAGVRRAMTAQQQRIAERGCIIMAGRDIGTVVLPNADCKIFLTASVEARARRRMADRLARGQQVTWAQMRDEILQRDAIDSSRSVAPLRAAADAIYLDNSALTLAETVTRALEIIRARCGME